MAAYRLHCRAGVVVVVVVVNVSALLADAVEMTVVTLDAVAVDAVMVFTIEMRQQT